jgi:hypothetical protein
MEGFRLTLKEENESIPFVNLHGQAMFTIEKLKSGAVLLNEYTVDGIIKHEFENLLHMECWAMKYRKVNLA